MADTNDLFDYLNQYLSSWSEDPLIRATGLIATVLFILPMLFRSDKNLKAGLAIGNLFAVYHLWALGSTVAALLSLAAFVRLSLSVLTPPNSKSSVRLAFCFSLFYLLSGAVFYVAPIDLLALTATLINTWAIFIFKGTHLRATLALAMCIWVIFDLNLKAFELAISSALSAAAAFYAWHREKRLEVKNPNLLHRKEF